MVQEGGGETTDHALTDITYHVFVNKDIALLILKRELVRLKPDSMIWLR